MANLKKLGKGIWTWSGPFNVLGLELGCRMTVVRLDDGSLWLHSPVRGTNALRHELNDLGEVRHAVSPNLFHHVFLGDWKDDDVTLYAPQGLDRKRPELELTRFLRDKPEPAWAREIDQVNITGMPLVNETAFFHRRSKTLILTDTLFNIGLEAPGLTRVVMFSLGAFGKPAVSFSERFLLIQARAATAACIREILEWDFERIVMSHGKIVESDAKDSFASAYSWLIDAKDQH